MSATFRVENIDHGNSRLTLIIGQAAEVVDEVKAEIAGHVANDDIAFETSPITVWVPDVSGVVLGQLVKLSLEL